MILETEREAITAACRRLAEDGLVLGTAGNVSVRAGDRVVVTPTGGVFARLEPEQMTVVDLDGELVDGDLAPTSELALHLGAYRRLEWPGAVVHTRAEDRKRAHEYADAYLRARGPQSALVKQWVDYLDTER